MATLSGHGGSCQAVAFSPDGKLVLTGSADNTARLWDAATGKPVATLAGTQSASCGGLLARRQAGADRLRTDRAAVGGGERQAVATLGGPRARQGGGLLARRQAGADRLLDNTARLWHAADGKPVAMLSGHSAVIAVVFSPDGKLVLTGSWDSTARLWLAEHGKPVATLSGHGGSVNAVAFFRPTASWC